MTQYKRITGKVFGGNATATGNDPQIAQFGSALAGTFVGTTDPETIQQLPAWGEGWSGAVTPETQFPPMPEMTGAMKVLSHQICGILQQGVSTWDSGTVYYTDNFCSKDGAVYVSLTDENQGNDPVNDNINWRSYGGANLDLSNLSAVGEKHFLNKTQISNCLLEVPQRIKYTFENGVITVKSGSVILFPYGVEDLSSQYPKGATFLNNNFKVYDRQFADGKFFVWGELLNDLDVSANLTNADRYIVYNSYVDHENTINSAVTHNASSGETAPTSNGLWYDTANNYVYYYYTSTQEKRLCSLPLGVITTSATAIENIKHIFNGFGYIANTMYADKGVKGLIPNGRNADGTLNNIEFETQSVLTRTITSTSSVNGFIGLNANSILAYTKLATRYYDADKNYFFNGANTLGIIIAGDFTTVSGVITEFAPKNAFKAVDYNDALFKSDKAEIVNWGIPDYSAIITNVSGNLNSAYTAPRDGYYIATIGKNDSGAYLKINGIQAYYYTDGGGVSGKVILPFVALVGKGDVCEWSATVDISYSAFVPLKGA